MARLNVARSIIIDSHPTVVADSLVDFAQWPLWSPWLCQESDANITYKGNTGEPGSGYAWKGKRVGAGRMDLISCGDTHINCDLTFLKPWKSRAKVAFDIQAQGGSNTRLTWSMQSSLPFFLFFMRRSFERFVGMDYERGLRMLKEHIETGTVNSRIHLSDHLKTLPACRYLALDASGQLKDLGPLMELGYSALEHDAKAKGLTISGPAFCHYTKMNPMKDQWVFTMGLPVDASADDAALRQRKAIPRCVHVEHYGDYAHLGNAWAAAFGAIRARKQQQQRKSGSFEVYTKQPAQAAADEVITEIYVPIR